LDFGEEQKSQNQALGTKTLVGYCREMINHYANDSSYSKG